MLRPDDLAHFPAARAPNARRRLAAARLCVRLLVGLAAGAALSLAGPESAWAEPAPSKMIVVYVEGPDAESVRSAVLAVLPETVTAVDPKSFSAALRKTGARPPLGATLGVKSKRDKPLGQIRKALGDAKADAAVVGVVRRTRGTKKELVLLYVDSIPGDLAVDQVIEVKGTDADLLQAIDAALGPTLKELAPAGAPKEAPEPVKPAEPPKPVEEEPAGARAPHQIGSALVVGELGFELTGRWFRYSDGITQNLRPYSVFGAPTLSIAAEVYPMAGSSIEVVKDLGLQVSYARAFGLDSAIEGGDPISTTYQRIGVGVRVRRDLGEGLPIVGLSAGLRLLEFSFDAPDPIEAEVPDVSYALLRLGVDGRMPAGPIAIAAMVEYLAPLSTGDVYDRFKDPSVAGIGLGAGVIYPAMEGVEVRLWGEYTRFFSAFSPDPGDPYVAGGALDQLLGLRLSGAYIY